MSGASEPTNARKSFGEAAPLLAEITDPGSFSGAPGR